MTIYPQVYRLEPQMPPSAYTTYQAVRPRATHTRPASCGEVDCPAYLNGWKTLIDTAMSIGRARANYIRLKSGRHFTAATDGTQVTFTFPAGQKCFTEHRITVDRPTIYLKRGGDWRATTIEPVQLDEADWIDDFANHQINLSETVERG